VHDLKAIRENPEAFDAAMQRRGFVRPQSQPILQDDGDRRHLLSELQSHQADRNAFARVIGQAKREGRDTFELEKRGAATRTEMERLEATLPDLDRRIQESLSELPNTLDPDVPDGADELANRIEKTWGTIRNFDFTPQQHFRIGAALSWMDFDAAAKLSGSRFTVLYGELAQLERALGQFMLDLHTDDPHNYLKEPKKKHGYTEISPPLLVNDAAAFGTGQLPKFKDDLFQTIDGRWLIPTAEVPLTNLAAGQILSEVDLPMRLTALTPCFRLEAGSAGRDTRGMMRQHQFWKVEMVSIVTPETSDAEHERMTCCAETVLELLDLPYRRMLLCAGDTGFSAAKTYDLEVWLPGQGMYREISSCSNTRAFQARRMNARYRKADGKPDFLHTLNGSGVAVGRALIAVLENYQNPDGSVTIPEALRPYMNGLEKIG
jgi:seryl-tRNA synthetase